MKSHRFLLILAAMLAFCLAPCHTSAQEPTTQEPGKLAGIVVKVVTDGNQEGPCQTTDELFGALPGDNLGNSIATPNAEEIQIVTSGNNINQSKQTVSAAIPSQANKLPARSGKAEEFVSKGEIGVDWSHWVSVLADRWYFNLKNMELRSGKAFRSLRPALIRFTCYRSGNIGGVRLRQSCGVPAYDQMQIEALRRCTPLPPFPEGSARMSYTLLQGWECHARRSGENDFKPGSYGKNFPPEKLKIKQRKPDI